MVDITIVLKKVETITEFREHRDIVGAYETNSQGDPSLSKFDIVKLENLPPPRTDFYEDLIEMDKVGSGIFGDDGIEEEEDRNGRLWYLDADELTPPQRNELNNTGRVDVPWGQVKDAVRLKSDRILETDSLGQRRSKSRPITDADVTG